MRTLYDPDDYDDGHEEPEDDPGFFDGDEANECNAFHWW